MRQRNKITLIEWIDGNGISTIAGWLGVDVETVRVWKKGRGLPKTEQMRAIKKLTNGMVGYDQIIDGTK